IGTHAVVYQFDLGVKLPGELGKLLDWPQVQSLRIVDHHGSRESQFTHPITTRNSELIAVRFLEQLLNVFGRLALLEELAKRVVPQLPGDVFQSTQVISRPVRR